MKKIVYFFIVFTLSYNFAFAETAFYEDFSFYGELTTDINLDKVTKEQEIQVAFPSPYNRKIPMVLNGKATLKKIGHKSMILLTFNELSLNARRRLPVEVLVTAVNGKKLKQACYPDQIRYITGLKNTSDYAKELATFPINRYSAMPKIAKPSGNNFVMLLEPFYAFAGGALFAISPITAPFYEEDNFCDIHRASIVEFEFLKEISREELEKAFGELYL